MQAFITGSQAYGTPTEKSDIDLVVRVDWDTAQKLRGLSDTPDPVDGLVVVRFGRLNLILCETDEEFAVWKVGTSQLMLKPTNSDKQQAMEAFNHLRDLVGVYDRHDSGGE